MNVRNVNQLQMNSAQPSSMAFVFFMFFWGFYYWNAGLLTYIKILGTS